MHDLLIPFLLVAAVLMLSGVVSAFIRNAPISVPMIFLGLGLLLGEGGLGVLRIGAHDRALEVVAVLSLAFVLFLDAVNLRFDEGVAAWREPMLALGPGTLLTTAIVALAAHLLFATSLVNSLLLGAILSSIDPVVLRSVVSDERVPRSIRQGLTTEAGTNDIVVLPIILILVAISLGEMGGAEDWVRILVQIVLIGPLAGAAVGYLSIALMRAIRQRRHVSREYRALYGVGAILAAYVAGEAVGGSGFLAVFAAGVVITTMDYDLCDCFLEYGEVTAEMAMLLAFILFGALLSAIAGTVPLVPELLFALVVLGIARPVAIGLVLHRTTTSKWARLFIGWFGPRGLSSLLFALVVVADGVPGAERLLAITGVVVIASVVLHGMTASPLIAAYSRVMARHTLPEEREATVAGLFGAEHAEAPRISVDELVSRLQSDDPPVVLDVRSRAAMHRGVPGIPGSIRVPLDEIEAWAEDRSRERPIVAYCT
jgi:NhaP-type Na+/H+ or K+/H+ antiporter